MWFGFISLSQCFLAENEKLIDEQIKMETNIMQSAFTTVTYCLNSNTIFFIKPTTHMHTYVHIGGTPNIWCREYVVSHINTGNLPRKFPHRMRYKNPIPMEIKQTWCLNLSDIIAQLYR